MTAARIERDSMGEMAVPAEADHAPRPSASTELPDQPSSIPARVHPALGLIKKSAAQVNMDLGLLAPEPGSGIDPRLQAVAEGKHDDQFVLDVFQTGSGTSTNMNANEVIADRRRAGDRRAQGRSPVHPNDAVNMGQSSNDVIPTAIHVAALERINKQLLPSLLN